MSYHHQQFISLLKKLIGEFLDRECEHPKGMFISVTDVVLDESQTRAEVLVSLYPADNNTNNFFRTLKKKERSLKYYLTRSIQRRRIPHVVFKLDTSQAEKIRLEKLLQNIENT